MTDMGVCARCDEPAVVMITDAPGNGRCAVHAAAIFPDPPRTPAAQQQQDDPCRFCQSRPPTGCCFAQPPAPQTPMQEQPRAEGPYVTGLPPDQMTALERQLTAEVERLTKRSDQQMQAGLRIAAERDQLMAVVEAARDVVADIENDGSMRSSTLAKLLAALDALDGSHAAPDEAHSRL